MEPWIKERLQHEKEARIKQYMAARQAVLHQWESRANMLESYKPETITKLCRMHKIEERAERGETMFAILQKEWPMPDLRRYDLTPADVDYAGVTVISRHDPLVRIRTVHVPH